jgi:hypothetical protein
MAQSAGGALAAVERIEPSEKILNDCETGGKPETKKTSCGDAVTGSEVGSR